MVMGPRCPECGRELVEISVERGERCFTLRSCSSCDRREWCLDGDQMPLTGVLDELTRLETATG